MSFPAPAPGFDDPLGMLRACHDRVLRYARGLAAVARREEDPATLIAVHHYFSTAGRDHHADEEQDLFPVILPRAAGALVAELVRQHRALDALWATLTPGFARPELLCQTLAAPAFAFAALSESHVALENTELLPLAARLLTRAETETLGARMATRRGVVFRTTHARA
ncbi:MAG: hemerythrin domain-containing protein [Acidiferrobacteraceae bacterium]